MNWSIGVLECWSGGWKIQRSGGVGEYRSDAQRGLVRHSVAPQLRHFSVAFMALALGLTCFGQPPIISQQPQSQTINIGSSVSFTVTVSSVTFVTYQWRFNGANIPGGTSAGGNTSTYAINNV